MYKIKEELLEELQAQLIMEYKITKWSGIPYRGKAINKEIEFENSQEMFDYLTRIFGSHSGDSIELCPYSNDGDYLLFFDEANVIKNRERWEKHNIEVELKIEDDEGNRINIDSLSDLINLDGVDSSGITVKEFNHYIENGN